MKKFFAFCAVAIGVIAFSKVKTADTVVAQQVETVGPDIDTCEGKGDWCGKLDTVVLKPSSPK
ncbi:MAG: hypothetical protein ACK5H1_08220 [Tenacibaculum sp.]